MGRISALQAEELNYCVRARCRALQRREKLSKQDAIRLNSIIRYDIRKKYGTLIKQLDASLYWEVKTFIDYWDETDRLRRPDIW